MNKTWPRRYHQSFTSNREHCHSGYEQNFIQMEESGSIKTFELLIGLVFSVTSIRKLVSVN